MNYKKIMHLTKEKCKNTSTLTKKFLFQWIFQLSNNISSTQQHHYAVKQETNFGCKYPFT